MQATTTYHLPTSNSKSGEGLVWDSEVTIEIEGQSPITIDTPTIPEAFQLLGDENKGIFDSHVEITVEADSSSASLEALSSPIFTASQKSGCSLASTLSVGTSPPDAHQVEFFWPSPPSYRKHDDGLRSHKSRSDFDDADDEFEGRTVNRNPPAVSRGRLAFRTNLDPVETCHSDVETPAPLSAAKMAGNATSRMQGLRSLSTTLLASSKTQASYAENSPLSVSASILPPSTPKSRNPFRSVGVRKTSPLVQHEGVFESTSSSAPESRTQEPPPALPRKSNLRGFAQFIVQDLKRTKATKAESDGHIGTSRQDPISGIGKCDIDSRIEVRQGCSISESPSDTIFETASIVTSVQSNEQSLTDQDESRWTSSIIPSIPKSSTMNTLRALISDLNLGLDTHDKVTGSRIADVTELRRMDVLEASLQEKQHEQKLIIQTRPPALKSLPLVERGRGFQRGLQGRYMHTTQRWI